MQRRTFAAALALAAAGCGSAAATRGDDAGSAAPPIAADIARAPVAPAPPGALDPRSPSRPMAYVEGEVITYREILQRIAPMLAQIDSPEEKARMEEHELTLVLRERLLYRAAVDAGIRITRDELDAQRAKIVKGLEKTGGTLEAWLQEHDMTRREFVEMNRVQIAIDKYRRAAIGHSNDPSVRVRPVTDTYVSPEEVRRYYDSHPFLFTQPAGARYRMLVVKSDLEAADREAAVAAARTVARSAVDRLTAGEDWVPVFRELSNAPLDPRQPDGLCSTERGKPAEWIERFVFDAPKGAVHLEEKGTTFYVLQAEGAHDAGVVPFEKAAREIRRKLGDLKVGMAFLEVELSVLDESSVQPESVRTGLRDTLRRARAEYLAAADG